MFVRVDDDDSGARRVQEVPDTDYEGIPRWVLTHLRACLGCRRCYPPIWAAREYRLNYWRSYCD